ncbi:MAG: hypothetical protein IJ468_04590 [Lachnospiraceae bacterium]|nr:hypothetical protein [Lachnospiraceae bacterium]
MNLVEVADIVYNKKALTRTFRPTASANAILEELFLKEYRSFRQLFSDNTLLASMVQSELDSTQDAAEIQRLEQILETFKKNL